METNRLLLITQPNSYRIAPYLNAARSLDIEVMIASRGQYSLVSEVHDGLHIDLDNLNSACERILELAKEIPFSGVLGSDDSTVELAARVAQKLGLPHNPPDAARLTCRKDLARAHLSHANCSVPQYFLVDLNQPLESQAIKFPWPCVVKPLNMSASRGVIRVNTIEEFLVACERVKAIISSSKNTYEKTHVLVEQYIDGIEVAYEGYLSNGELTTLTLFDKPDPLVGPFFEETIYIRPSRLTKSIQDKIKKRLEEAIKAYGLVVGPIHAELRVDEKDAWILEVASRSIGGDCARTLDSGGDFSLEQLIVSLAVGLPVIGSISDGASGVMMIPIIEAGILKRVEGLSAARQVNHIQKVDIIAREGHELIPLPEGNQYAGYIFAIADSSEEVERALRLAYKELKIVVAPVFQISMA